MKFELWKQCLSMLVSEENVKQERQFLSPVSFVVLAWTSLLRVLIYIRQECDSESFLRLQFHPRDASRCRYYLGVALLEKWGAKAMLPCFTQSLSDSSRLSAKKPPNSLWDDASLDVDLDVNTTLKSFVGIPLSALRTYGVWTETKSSCGPYWLCGLM